MSRIRSDRTAARLTGTMVGLVVLAMTGPAAAQQLREVQSSEFNISGAVASLDLGFDGGESLSIAIRDGGVFIDGVRVGDAARGSTLDRQWRDLLNRAMDTPSAELPRLLVDWSATGDAGTRMDSALEAAFAARADTAARDVGVPEVAGAVPGSDSVSRLVERISELEQMVDQLEDRRAPRITIERPERRSRNPFHYITEGIAGIFSILVTYVVLFAIGFGVIFFGGRKYIEGVADTARHATGRSFLVGMAAAFLVVPAFVLGIIALIISIIGIPGLLVFVPAFPMAVVLSILLGYLGVAHAAGEAFAARRFYVTDWFKRGNSYYFLLSGLGLLLALFLAAQVVHMAGSWLQAIKGILVFLGVVSTIIAVTVGFGAVLLSRGGTRPVRGAGMAEHDLYAEEAGV
jgi:hypothetical protein